MCDARDEVLVIAVETNEIRLIHIIDKDLFHFNHRFLLLPYFPKTEKRPDVVHSKMLKTIKCEMPKVAVAKNNNQ